MAPTSATGGNPATSTAFPKSKRKLDRNDHQRIQTACSLDANAGEDYACVFQRGKGFAQWSIHVFNRHPTQKEIDSYEQTASRMAFRGQKAKIEGSQITAAVVLYNLLVSRAYDVLVGLKSHDKLPREQAIVTVPPLVKREAVRQLIGEVYSESRLAESEGEEDESGDDDAEGHTSGEPEA